MTSQRHYSPADRLLMQADSALRTLLPFSGQPARPSPAVLKNEAELSESETRHVAGLMRINHTGEVCAQALYQGQALTARLPQVRRAMEQAADEEIDHLAWCEQRIRQLGSHTSVLNPLFYGLSFGIGATAGLISDRISLGFVAATEDQVCKHLDEHLGQLPASDDKSRAILEQMRGRAAALHRRHRGRRPAISSPGQIRHEPGIQGHDQGDLSHLTFATKKGAEAPSSMTMLVKPTHDAACCARRKFPASRDATASRPACAAPEKDCWSHRRTDNSPARSP